VTAPSRSRPLGPERSLRLATGLAAAEATGLIVVVLVRNGGRTPLLALALALKYPLCIGARRLAPGGFLGLLLWEVVGGFLAVVAPGVPLLLRIGEAVVAATVVVLLARSAKLFPSPRLPER
jgi:hypothetical protein